MEYQDLLRLRWLETCAQSGLTFKHQAEAIASMPKDWNLDTYHLAQQQFQRQREMKGY